MLLSISKTKEKSVARRLLSLPCTLVIEELLQDDEDTATINFSLLGSLLSPKSLSVYYSRGIEEQGSVPSPSSFELLTVFVDWRLCLRSDRLSRSFYSH